MRKRNAVALTAVLTMTTTPLFAEEAQSGIGKSNFSYSTVGGYLGRVTPDEEIVFLNEVYEDFGAAGINGAVQLADNLAIGASAGIFTNEGNRTEITNSSISLNLFVPIPIGDRVDLIPRVGMWATRSKLVRITSVPPKTIMLYLTACLPVFGLCRAPWRSAVVSQILMRRTLTARLQ